MHNQLRNSLALGQDTAVNTTVSNMRLMRWDKELESIAQCFVNTCGSLTFKKACFNNIRGGTQENLAHKKINSESELNKPAVLLEHMKEW